MASFPLSLRYPLSVFHLRGWAGAPDFNINLFREVIEDEGLLPDAMPDEAFHNGSRDTKTGWSWAGDEDELGRVQRPEMVGQWMVIGRRTWSKSVPAGLLKAKLAQLERDQGVLMRGQREEVRDQMLLSALPNTKLEWIGIDTSTMRVFLFGGSQAGRTYMVQRLRNALLVAMGIANDMVILAGHEASWELVTSEQYLVGSRPTQQLPGYVDGIWMDWIASEGLPPKDRVWDPSGTIDEMEWWQWWTFDVRSPAGPQPVAMRWMVVGDVQVEVENGQIDVHSTEAVHQAIRDMQTDGTRINECSLWVELCSPNRGDKVHQYMVKMSSSAWRPVVTFPKGALPTLKRDPFNSNAVIALDALEMAYSSLLYLLDLFNTMKLTELLRSGVQAQMFGWHDARVLNARKIDRIGEIMPEQSTPLEEAIAGATGWVVVLVATQADSSASVIRVLNQLFDVDEDEAAEMLTELPLPIATGLRKGQAEDRADYLRKAGASVRVMEAP